MPRQLPDDVVMLPCFEVDRIVIARKGHPVLNAKRVTLDAIARHPLITYDETFGMRESIVDRFERAGLTPHVVISAVDTDVMKTYTAAGVGIAIVASVAFNARADRELGAIHASNILGRDTIYVGVRRHAYLRRFVHDFVGLFAPNITRKELSKAVGLQV